MQKNNNTFNGSTSDTTGTITYPQTQFINDPIVYCPFCGKHLPVPSEDIHYCPFCGKAIPRTYTGSSYIIHWNLPTGEPTYPRDGIIYPYTTC